MDVLIFEDDTNAAELVAETLAAEGYAVEKYYTGQGALEEVRRHKPRLVLLDVMMPMMDGLSLCRALKSDPATTDTKVMVATAKRYKRVEEDAYLCGAQAFLFKPFDRARLLELVAGLIGRPGSADGATPRARRPAAIMGQVWGSWAEGGSDVTQPTPSLSLQFGKRLVLLDGGGGLAAVSRARKPDYEKEVWLFLASLGEAHVRGLRHLASAFPAGYALKIAGPADARDSVPQVLRRRLLQHETPAAKIQPHAVAESEFQLAPGIQAAAVYTLHPRNALAYRLGYQGRSVVYAPANELEPEDSREGRDFREKFGRFVRGADVLIHDARYLDADWPAYRGAGHSAPSQAVKFAKNAGVRRLILFTTDPRYPLDQLGAALKKLREGLIKEASSMTVEFAQPGLTFFA